MVTSKWRACNPQQNIARHLLRYFCCGYAEVTKTVGRAGSNPALCTNMACTWYPLRQALAKVFVVGASLGITATLRSGKTDWRLGKTSIYGEIAQWLEQPVWKRRWSQV